MLFDELLDISGKALLNENIGQKALKKPVEAVEEARYLRRKLDALGLIAFIADDSILPRKSGTAAATMKN